MNNNDQLRQIADRIKYLREILEVSDTQLAQKIDMPVELYRSYESCEKDIPISMIYSVASALNVDPTELLTGETPRMSSYAVTRKGQGVAIERYKGYAFESLAYNFIDRDKEPMLVTISPSDKKPQLVTHGGQEFNYVISGKVGVTIGAKTIILSEGDSIYFNPEVPHGQFAAEGEAKFLTVIDKE
jgi:mannose-6-phosphate isomerase-like protein (cupin superfamily)